MTIYCARFFRGQDDDNPDNRITLMPDDESGAVDALKDILVAQFERMSSRLKPTDAILFTVGVDGVVQDRRAFSMRPDGVVEVALSSGGEGRIAR